MWLASSLKKDSMIEVTTVFALDPLRTKIDLFANENI